MSKLRREPLWQDPGNIVHVPDTKSHIRHDHGANDALNLPRDMTLQSVLPTLFPTQFAEKRKPYSAVCAQDMND